VTAYRLAGALRSAAEAASSHSGSSQHGGLRTASTRRRQA